jgi:YVTN family beta-propeller protein
VIEITAGILDLLGGPLENPGTSTFLTRDPPPLEITSVTPPSGPRGVPIVISGTGFSTDPDENIVYFNDVTGAVTGSSDDYLNVVVPIPAPAGPVSMLVDRDQVYSNELLFRVLTTDSIAIDEDVIQKVGTGSTTRSVAMTPDGVRLYAVSPQANTVTCIDVFNLATLAVIPVGENPYSITIHHEGNNAYVTNFLDHTVSVLDISPVSDDFNEVVETVPVGINPLDAIATPDGDRLIVSNMGSLDLSVIDADRSSETFNMVLATVSTGKTARSMAVTPDGGLLYVCTEDGYLVVDVLDFGVVSTVTTGKTTRTSVVTPDGALLIILTTEGEVLFFDIVPDSPTENEVIGKVTVGSGTRSMALTPDGAFLFLIPNEGDGILVVELGYTTSAGVLIGGDFTGPGQVYATVVDTFYTGEDPSDIAFAPNGTGATVVTNAGDNSISVYNPNSGPIAVHLTGFDVEQKGESARVSWRTHVEQGTVGFRILRSEDGRPYERVGPGLMAAMGPSEYVFVDRDIRPRRRYSYRLEEITNLGTGQVFGPVEFTYMARFNISQNVPNPFNPETRISFTLPDAEHVRLIIYDVAGREVRRLVDRRLPADHYTVTWNGKNNRGSSVASGVYFYRIAAGKNIATKKMVLLR